MKLYLKKHPVKDPNGAFKYLGCTTQDINTYNGSGSDWKKHLKTYGSKHDTIVIYESNDTVEFEKKCRETSKFLNVVESNEFFNLCEESGINFWHGGQSSGYSRLDSPMDDKESAYRVDTINGNVNIYRKDPTQHEQEDVILNPEMCVDVSYLANREVESSSLFDYSELRAMGDIVSDMLEMLKPREARIIKLRFGIGMRTDYTLEEVGQMEDVTRDRIRQIEAKALRKLRHKTRSKKLRTFLSFEELA